MQGVRFPANSGEQKLVVLESISTFIFINVKSLTQLTFKSTI